MKPGSVGLPAAVLLDMDGVLYRGASVIADAPAFVDMLGDRPYAFITNNSAQPAPYFRQRLEAMGFRLHPQAPVLTSADITARYLSVHYPGFSYFAIGGEGLHLALAACGREDKVAPDFVVVGEGPGLDFASLTRAANMLLSGSGFIATNPDHAVDHDDNGIHLILPGCGALYAPLEVMTGLKPLVMGKPQPALYMESCQILQVSPQQCLMIGDRPDTDIAGAVALGMQTALVRTGRFGIHQSWPEDVPRPDHDVCSLTALAAALGWL